MLLAQIIPYISACIETRWLNQVLKLRWLLIASGIAVMIVIGAIAAESHHLTAVSEANGSAMAREREVRHHEVQFGETFRPHSWYAGEI